MNQTPLLSIGIIFKNEARCLERCLKSLQPLRDALPCELIMADTGATDGSRDIAAKYADILFDFPWINDFAAARNAVMDRSSGEWYMTIDCDEWVDPNIQGFVTFLTSYRDFDFASVIIRNYFSEELENGGSYSDFLATRLLRMSTGLRYEGSVHEHWCFEGDFRTMLVSNAVFHHDGYLFQDEAKMHEKQERNMALLREQLKERPDDLVILTQCIESSDRTWEQADYLRRAMTGVAEEWSQWEMFGGPIYRYAVRFAIRDNLPVLGKWIREAEEKFPDSIFTRVEVAYFAFGDAWNRDDYPEAIRWGERYLQGVDDYHAGNFNRSDILASSLDKADPHSRLSVATVLASGYLHEKQPEKCLRLMEGFDGREMNAKQAGDCVRSLCDLYRYFGVDTGPLVLRLWEEINEPKPNQAQADQRRGGFLQIGEGMFDGGFIRAESASADVIHHAYMVFLPLKGECVLGDAAAMLETDDPGVLEALLSGVRELEKLPVHALYYAIGQGVPFPPEGTPLKIEQMDLLARRMAQDTQSLLALALGRGLRLDGRRNAAWARGVLLTAVSAFDWKGDGPGMGLARAWAAAEQAFLPLCYAPDTLREDNLYFLPPMHRFGWYLVRAFEALDAGDAAGYIRLLRAGLAGCGEVKDMVGFLTNHTPELQGIQAPPPSEELKALADQVRGVLSRFPPDDPAVAALKESEAYQRVAYLIEGIAAAQRILQ